MKKVFVAGYFNILHPGHLRLLRFAKELGDHLTVMVIGDEKNNPRTLLSQEVRLESIKSIGCVDHAFISKLPVSDEIEKFSPDFVVKGKEYEKLFNPEKNIVEKYGGKLVFSSGETAFSSEDLVSKEVSELGVRRINLPTDYLSRHKITSERLLDLIAEFKNRSICVIGDTIVDEYISCQALGMSQEDSTTTVESS